MKRSIAIFAFSVFFFAQFGKVINYCYCKAVVYEQTKSFICDCEKQLYTLNTDKPSKEEPGKNISSQLPTEELFHFSAPLSYTIITPVRFTAWPKTGSESLYYVFGKNIFRPPLQVS